MMDLLQLELLAPNYDPDSQETASLYKTCTKKHLYSKYVQYSHHSNEKKKETWTVLSHSKNKGRC